MNFFKRTLAVLLAFIFGWLGIALEFVPHQNFSAVYQTITKGLIIITAIAAFLGIYNLLRMHYLKIRRKNEGWGYSGLVWLSFFIMIFFGFYNSGNWFWNSEVEGGGRQWLYTYVFTTCQATMFSILAFFMASAAYRTFRAKTLEAAILLLAAVIVMFGQVPIGNAVWSGFPTISQWLLDYPNLAVKRAIYFGIALGGISTALRIIFGIERSYLGGE